MLRIKHKNISMQFVMLLILCLCYGLTMALWLTVAHAAERQQQPYYIVDTDESPGMVYRIQNGEPSTFFRRRLGRISSIAIFNRQLYFCSINDKKIYRRMGQHERVVFEHRTNVRDIAVDSIGNLYFSQASDAKGNGTIYKLNPRVNELGPKRRFSISKEERPIRVHLKTVDGFWAGYFTFDARDNLYLSSGRTPTFIYRVQRERGSQYGSPRKIYEDTEGAIKGIAIEPNRQPNVPQYFIYYADWKKTIYRLDIRNLKRSVEFSGNISRSRNPHLSDIAFDIGSP